MKFSRFLFIFALVALFSLTPGYVRSEAIKEFPLEPATVKSSTIADAFLNEELTYTIGFWFFDDVATGKVSLRKGENGDYIATLNAKTTGFVGKVMKNRKDSYVAHLRLAEGGRRFVTQSFEKIVEIDGKVKKSVTVLDYDKRVMKWKSWINGKEEHSKEVKLPPGIYCDGPLAAFYNFRFGVYGPIKEGREYRMFYFPKEDHVPEIKVSVATQEELNKRFRDRPASADYLANVQIDKELFGSQSGDVDIIFTDDLLPTQVLVKDLVFFGDVRGKLTQLGTSLSFSKQPTLE
ncbi:MAG: DUF3108 domain-containing protein [Deltaproteobacteria bacterium]|nr:DUF3108 domain-containing protein [Deltaproteobacteria bacterium]